MTGAPIDLPEWLERLGFADDEYVQIGEKLPGGAFRGGTGTARAIYEAADGWRAPADRDVWVGPNPTEHVTTGRPGNDQVTRLAALHIDLDVKPGGCSSFDQARAIVDELAGMLGSRPVALTYSGHGLQPVWAIEDGWIIESSPDHGRADARALMRRWGRLVASVADRHGAHVDALWDLTRILRCPGSVNHKDPANPVPVVTFGDTGAPITVERILETLDEWGVVELPEDTKGAGAIVAPPSEWTYADRTCPYAAGMVQQWLTDQPTERHGWLLQNAPRIAAAVRYGCFDRAGHGIAVATLSERFLALLGNTRKPTPGEISGALSWGQEAAACMSDNHLASELGYHLHAEPIPAPPDRKAADGHVQPTHEPVRDLPGGPVELAPEPSIPGAGPGDAALADGPIRGLDTEVAPAQVEPTAWDLLVEQEQRKLRLRDEAREMEDRRKAGGIAVPQPIRLDTFLSVPDEPVRYRIHGLMPTNARVMLAAQFKAGKTTTVGNLVRSLVDLDPFLQHFQVEPTKGAVVVIDDEMSEQQLRRWLRDQGIARTDAVSVVSLRGRVGSFDILNEAVRARWATALSTVGCGLLVFDCLRPVLDALGLSEDKEAGRFLVAFDALLAEAGISEAVVVHHMGHGGERSRGDSRIRDWPDVEWRLVRDVKQGEEDPAAPRFFSAFGRDVSVPEGLVTMSEANRHLHFDAETNRKDNRKAQSEAGEPDPHQLIMRFLLDNPGALAGEIDGHLNMRGVGLGRARRARQDMSGRGGPIRMEPIPGGKAVKHFYEVPTDDNHSTAVDSPCDVNPRTNPRPSHGRGMTSHGSPYRGPVDDPSLTGFESSYDSDPFRTGLSA